MNNNMQYYWIKNINEYKRISKEWDNLICLSDKDNPFILSDFIITWWNYYGENLELNIFILYEDGKVIGGIPLCKNQRGILEYPGGWAANYTEILSFKNDNIIWAKFIEAISERNDWRMVKIKRYREDYLNKLWINKKCCKNLLFDIFSSDNTYLINIPEDFSGYIKTLPRKLRYYVKRSEKEFSKLGEITLSSVSEFSEIKDVFELYIKFSCEAFKKRNKQSAFENKKYCAFFKELIDKFYKLNYLDVNVLKLNNKIIGIHFGYSIGNNLNYILPSFDINYAKLNPGHLLIYKLLKLGSMRKNKLFDMYTGYHLYKKQWSNSIKEVVSVYIQPNNVVNRVKNRIIVSLRSSPFFHKITYSDSWIMKKLRSLKWKVQKMLKK